VWRVTKWDEFAHWWVATEPGLLRAARKYNLSPEGAKDIVQDVAVLAIRNCDRFTSMYDFQHWAFARLHWLLLDEFRSLRRRPRELIAATAERSVPPAQEQDLLILDIWRLIEQLPERQQAALIGMIEGRSPAYIARELNVKEATIRSLQRHARKKLVSLLAEQEITT
jgi:RNA polymerase sigma-70 factor (ECF subfamily)